MRLRQGIRCIRLTGSIQQKLCAQCLKALDGFLPALCDAAWIFARGERVEGGLVAHQAVQRVGFEMIRIQVVQRCGDFEAQFRGVESLPIGEDDADPAAPLT